MPSLLNEKTRWWVVWWRSRRHAPWRLHKDLLGGVPYLRPTRAKARSVAANIRSGGCDTRVRKLEIPRP